MEDLHKLSIDLSKLSVAELLNLTKRIAEIAKCSNILDELTDEMSGAAGQIVAYTELANK